jgi:NhaA family Na+:H+ antiporter
MTRDAVLHQRLSAQGHVAPSRLWHRVSGFALDHFLLLPAGVAAALAWANLAAESYFRFAFAAAFWVNDVAMVIFFGLLTKEIVEATARGGVLHSWRRATVPIVAGGGAALAAALLYRWLVVATDNMMLEHAWPIALATDLALAYFLVRVIFRAHPIVPFVLLMGMATNALAFLLMPFVTYPPLELNVTTGGIVMALALFTAAALRKARVKSFWPYVIAGGGLSWYALYWAGVHPGLALVPIVPFIGHAARDRGFLVDPPKTAHDALSQFERTFHGPMHVALFLFGLVNGGVLVRALEPSVWALPIAALVGKPLGMFAAVILALAAGFHLPHRVGWRELLVAGILASSGFTIGLFMASAMLAPGQSLAMTRMGVLLTLAAIPLGVFVAARLHVGRFGDHRSDTGV